MAITTNDLSPAIGETVLVRFESLEVQAKILNSKVAWGQVRVLIAPTTGNGTQWVDLSRVTKLKLPVWVSDAIGASSNV